MKRRKFLTDTAIASTAFALPTLLSSCTNSKVSDALTNPDKSGRNKKLVVIQLKGGNDGLNTFIPYRNDIYYRSRPNISLSDQEVLRIDDNIGFHPALSPLKSLYDDGMVAVINNVGYPNPNRSHFKSSDIWHSGVMPTDSIGSTGWLGRYMDLRYGSEKGRYKAIELEDSLDLIVKGNKKSAFTFGNSNILNEFNREGLIPFNINEKTSNETLSFLRTSLAETKSYANNILSIINKERTTSVAPDTEFGQKLKIIAELIKNDLSNDIYFLNLDGFDTHSNQKARQNKVLSTYAEGIKYFMNEMKSDNLDDDVLVFTFSEFGRRVAQNASKGTDHGKANNVIVIGKQLKSQGFINDYPDLSKLDKGGDLVYNTDFRSVYATILEDWLGMSSNKIFKGNFEKLGFV